jgi:hypothetical protein
MLLDLADLRQDDEHSCGAVALEVLFRFHGTPPGRWKHLVRELVNPVDGLYPDTVVAILHSVFGVPPLRGSMEVDDLRHLTRTGRPVLCLVRCDAPDQTIGHWVVCRGVGRGRVYCQCPTNGRVSYVFSRWSDTWTDGSADGYVRFAACGWPAR